MKNRIPQTDQQFAPSAPTSELCLDLGTLIRYYRVLSQLSSDEVAQYLNIMPSTYEKYESGEQPIPLHDLYTLSNFLNIVPREIDTIIFSHLKEVPAPGPPES